MISTILTLKEIICLGLLTWYPNCYQQFSHRMTILCLEISSFFNSMICAFSSSSIIQTAFKILAGLSHLNKEGFVHRCLSPSCILFDPMVCHLVYFFTFMFLDHKLFDFGWLNGVDMCPRHGWRSKGSSYLTQSNIDSNFRSNDDDDV